MDYVLVGIAIEAMPPVAAMIAQGNEMMALRISLGGSQKLKEKFVAPLLAGKIIGGSAISEPNVGSDPRSIETKAVLDGDQYVINGTKIWSSHGSVADAILAVVSTGRNEIGKNILSRIVVEREVSPYEARDIRTFGLRQHHLCEVCFDDCHVPAENIVGEEGDAHGAVANTWLSQRVLIGFMAVHVSQRALDISINYARERKQFGRVIGSFQLIQEKIVEMATLVETSRLLCYKAMAMLDLGKRASKESSMAKFVATEAAVKVTSMAMQIHGAFGISQEFPLEKLSRDAKTLIYPDGTPEIQKLIVGREILGIRAFS